MFFLASKVFGFFVSPSNALIVVCGLGAVLMLTRFRRCGRNMMLAGVLLLAVFGFSPLGNLLLLPLTERFPPWLEQGPAPDGIIVLGGAIDPDVTAARRSIEMDASAERVLAMLELARRFPSARIVFSGGSANLVESGASEAPIAGRLLEDFGVARDRIVLESESRTTAENATLTRKLVEPKAGERWLLLTSAFHMPRAIGAFRKVGFEVEAYPVDWRTRGWRDLAMPFDKLSAGLARVDTAAHEWVGLFLYWLGGRSSEFFPAPREK